MDKEVVSFAQSVSSSVTCEVGEICRRSETIGEMIVEWVRDRRTIVMSRSRAHPGKVLAVELYWDRILVACVYFNADRMIAEYPDYRPLRRDIVEEIDPSLGIERFAWFRERNKRLGLRFVDDAALWLATPLGYGEILLSYSLARVGQVAIRAHVLESASMVCEIFHAHCRMIDLAGKERWCEQIATRVDRFSRFVAGRRERRARDWALRSS